MLVQSTHKHSRPAAVIVRIARPIRIVAQRRDPPSPAHKTRTRHCPRLGARRRYRCRSPSSGPRRRVTSDNLQGSAYKKAPCKVPPLSEESEQPTSWLRKPEVI